MLLGLALRLPGLSRRPMHTDEAVHAVKFGALLEENVYRYDPEEYHGPTLNYFTLIPAWLSSAKKLTDMNESTLRIVPAIFGVLLIVLILAFREPLGRTTVLLAALLTAVSPVMVFYSRYYIQEILLVCFTFAAIVSGYRYLRNRRIVWAVITGVFLGLMHASKETCILSYGSMAAAFIFVAWNRARQTKTPLRQLCRIKPWHVLAVFTAASMVSVLFYSSFFTNARGILDSFRTYGTYFHRAGHKAWHIHPWYFYFRLLIGSKQPGAPYWSELFIIIMACFGLMSIFVRKREHEQDINLIRFIGIYTVIMTLVYTFIPYKTPWSMLGFYHGFILLAALGAAFLFSLRPRLALRIVFGLYILSNTMHLTVQSHLSNSKFYCDTSNPYVYAHPVVDVYKVTNRIDQISRVHPDGKNMFVEVIYPGADYWPLPWYLRSYTRVGWWNDVDFDTQPAPVILAAPAVESELLRKLYELPLPGQKSLYLPLFDSYTELRPQVEIRGYVLKDLWDGVLREQERN